MSSWLILLEELRRLKKRLRGETAVSPSSKPTFQVGTCDACGKSFAYELFHCGFMDAAYAYCERCGQTALLSGWHPNIPQGAQLRIHQVIDPSIETYLRPCTCGGAFRAGAFPRCPECTAPISAGTATTWIEANAPGTKVGWRWQYDWTGLYAIVIEGRSVSDNWLADEPR